MRILIIEDELLTARDLARTILAVQPQAKILPFIQSVEQGITALEHGPTVNLIFADVELTDGLSFEILEKLNAPVPVIFCTAYHQYTLEAFHHFGIDYLLKPFDQASVEKALNKYELLAAPNINQYAQLMDMLRQQTVKAKSVVIRQADRIIPIEVDRIALIYYTDDTAVLHLFNGEQLTADNSMDKLEEQLAPSFFRANRQVLIHRRAVKEARQHFHRKLLVLTTIPFKEPIIVGKEKVTAFVNWLTLN